MSRLPKVVERFDPCNAELVAQTHTHHKKRYEFAAMQEGTAYLDLCCGTGYGTDILKTAHTDARVVGVDVDEATVVRASEKYPLCSFAIMDAMHLYFPSRFDVVVFFEAIEHFTYKNGREILDTVCSQILSDTGTLILSTPRDIQDKYNHYHKSVWTFAMLKNILGSSFSSVKIYGQSWETGMIEDDKVIDNDFYVCVCKKG